MTKGKVHPEVNCPICDTVFIKNRSNKKYCSEKCQKNASKKKTGRKYEYKLRNRDHYERSMWLTHDLFRTPEPNRSIMIQKLLEAASGDDAKIRNILLDPQLLGAGKHDPRGRSKHDCKIGVSNIAKQVYQFCMNNYGCSTKDCILDEGKPAGRFFVGDPIIETTSNIERCEPNRKHVTILKSLTGLSRQAYHGMLVVEFEAKLTEVKLGVEVSGNSSNPINISNVFNLSANGDESVNRIIQAQIPKITEASTMAIIDAKRRGRKGL